MLLGAKEGNSYIEGFEIHGRVNSLKTKFFYCKRKDCERRKHLLKWQFG